MSATYDPREPIVLKRWITRAGYPAQVLINPEGLHLCGYVALQHAHPLAGFAEAWLPFLDCHGGVTYSTAGPQFGEDDHVWWLGFDAAHSGDRAPGHGGSSAYGTYRDLDYMAASCETLGEDLRDWYELGEQEALRRVRQINAYQFDDPDTEEGDCV